jgi:hypothetical protein
MRKRGLPGWPGRASRKEDESWRIIASQKLGRREQRIAFEEMLLAVRQAGERVSRLEQAIVAWGDAGPPARRYGLGLSTHA